MDKKQKISHYAAYGSLIISVMAIIFSGLQWWSARDQLIFSVKPSVDFIIEDDSNNPPVGLQIENSGPGPALIKSVTWYVDGKSVGNYQAAIKAGKLNSDEIVNVEFEEGDTLAVGEKEWLLQHHKVGQEDRKELKYFNSFLDDRLSVEVNFCSLMNDCWTKCSVKDRCGK